MSWTNPILRKIKELLQVVQSQACKSELAFYWGNHGERGSTQAMCPYSTKLYPTSPSSLTTNILNKCLLQGQTGWLTSWGSKKKSKVCRELKLPFSCAHTWFSTTNDWYIGIAFLVKIERDSDYFGREGQIVMLQTLWFPKLSRAGQRKYHSVNFWLCPDTWTMLYSNAAGIIWSHISEKRLYK